MRKKGLTRALALALCAIAAVPAAACSTTGGSGGEAIDSSRTQVRVYHYNAGYGDKWVYELKTNFEALMADRSFEEGKTGVQVLITGDMSARTAEQWRAEQYDVLFLENPQEIYTMVTTGVLESLDSIAKVANPDDNNQTIISKMTEQQQAAYTYDGHLYAFPHYAGNYGIIYNRDMFEQKGFFLAAEPDEDTGDILISATNPTKSVGPDGQPGTEDDGLPRTYQEFYDLCAEIDAAGIDPLCWPGQYQTHHIMQFVDNLTISNLGYEQANLNYTMDGTATDLIVFNDDGSIKFEDDGETPVVESVEINEENAYLLARQKGKYDAFKFFQTILSNEDNYNEQDSIKDTRRSHVEMQQMFLENGSLGMRENAMLVDGCWWQMEADATFERMKSYDEKWAKENRKFGWMPLPQPTEEAAEAIANGTKKSTFSDYLNAVACIKSGLTDAAREASLEFLKYAYTDEALANFTYTVGATIGVEYLDVVDRSKLTYYESTLIDYINKSDIVYPISGTKTYISNVSAFMAQKKYCSPGVQDVLEAFAPYKAKNMSAEEYFIGHQNHFKGIIW
ncbi:MAG: extracellular solute-binding protein [Clostridia bacterium]|nr:extracellular solute-binding protein [Clostridia bacterium]